jgi:arylsulfatase A-like enzyme
VSDALISQIDIFPTLCELLAIDPPPWLQGHSFLPLVRGEVEAIHDAIFAEVTYHAAYEPIRAIRTERWKYIRRFDQHTGPVLANCDDSISKDLLLDTGWREHERPVEQLYDLLFDPTEVCNLVDHEAFTPVLQRMRARLKAWMEETNDPLLKGPIVAPRGTELNDQNQLSAGNPTHTVL